MEIVDAQVHLNQLVPDWRTAELDSVIATGIQTMDAVGVNAALIAESRGFDAKMRPALGPELPNGAIRAEFPDQPTQINLAIVTRRNPDVDASGQGDHSLSRRHPADNDGRLRSLVVGDDLCS